MVAGKTDRTQSPEKLFVSGFLLEMTQELLVMKAVHQIHSLAWHEESSMVVSESPVRQNVGERPT
jgi:hypothetical protein